MIDARDCGAVFQLDGTSIYELSHSDDIPKYWLTSAINGLEKLVPFCVKGFLAPDRFLCTVSFWNCHIICEDDLEYPLESEEVIHEISHTNMLQFCQYLYEDISQNFDDWVDFESYPGIDIEARREDFKQKLDKLKELIITREKYFRDKEWCFL